MRAIISWGLWQRRWNVLWWSVGMFLLILINLVFYPSFKDQAAELQKSFASLPETAVQFIGGSTDFFSPVGFLNSQIFFLMLPLILAILSIGLGSSLLAREEQDGTIESLLARPVSRAGLLTAKAVCGVCIVVLVAGVGYITTVIAARVVALPVSAVSIAAAFVLCTLMCLALAAVAYTLTAAGKARGGSLGIASLFGLGGYIVSSLSGTVDWLVGPSKLFAFYYYQPEAVLRGQYNWWYSLYFVALILGCGLVSWLLFRTRDIG